MILIDILNAFKSALDGNYDQERGYGFYASCMDNGEKTPERDSYEGRVIKEASAPVVRMNSTRLPYSTRRD